MTQYNAHVGSPSILDPDCTAATAGLHGPTVHRWPNVTHQLRVAEVPIPLRSKILSRHFLHSQNKKTPALRRRRQNHIPRAAATSHPIRPSQHRQLSQYQIATRLPQDCPNKPLTSPFPSPRLSAVA
jgi:hypothetical protein